MAISLAARSPELAELCRIERRAFAAKIRIARSVLGWSQSELSFRAGLTQRAIHKLEQGMTEPRRATVRALESIWLEQGVEFENSIEGGFRLCIRPEVLNRASTIHLRRRRAARLQLGVTSINRSQM